MPPTRSTKRTATAQSTLSFSHKHKVTKPTPKSKQKDLFSTKSTKSQESFSAKDSDSEVVVEKEDDSAEKQVEVQKPRTEKDIEALRVGDAQVKRYWRERESERIAARGNFCLIFWGRLALIWLTCCFSQFIRKI